MTSSMTEKFACMRREDRSRRLNCCVPKCSASSCLSSVLSFFTFPQDKEQREKWLVNIKREDLKITSHSKVCCLHFVSGDVIEHFTPLGRKKVLKKGAVPVLFEWNSYSLSAPGPRERTDPEHPPRDVNCTDHDYCGSDPQAGALDAARREHERLKAQMDALCKQIEETVLRSRFGLERFAASDEDIRFYTRFASYAHLMSFWSQIEPATGEIVRVTRAQSYSPPHDLHPAVPLSLQPIDEFFLFMTCLSLGLEPEDLAHRFQLCQSAVIRVIFSWASFLYTVLGAVGIWLDEDTVKQNMPEVFADFSDTHMVLVSTELRCHIPEHLLLYTAAPSSGFITHNIFKGLVGVAPHGPVMFVSQLYDGSISDVELVRQSGVVSLLQPSMAIMVNNTFLVEDLVPCKVHMVDLQNRQPLSGGGIGKNQPTVKLRAHLEYLKRRVRDYELFSTVIPFSLTSCINQLFAVACLLVNYQKVQLKPPPESHR